MTAGKKLVRAAGATASDSNHPIHEKDISMKKTIVTSGIFVAATALGLCALAGDASAYTRRVCGLAGTTDGAASWTTFNCSIKNNDAVNSRTVKYSIPIDSTANISAKTWVTGELFAPDNTCAILKTFQNDVIWSVGANNCTAGSGTQQLLLGPLTVPAGGSASVQIGVGTTRSVWDVEVTQ